MPETWVGPIAGAIGGILVAIVGGGFALRSARRGKEPDTTDAWAEADRARRDRYIWEDLYYLLRGAFKGYARRMQIAHGDSANLSAEEEYALNAPTPNDTLPKKAAER